MRELALTEAWCEKMKLGNKDKRKKWIDNKTRNERITTEVVEKFIVKLKPHRLVLLRSPT